MNCRTTKISNTSEQRDKNDISERTIDSQENVATTIMPNETRRRLHSMTSAAKNRGRKAVRWGSS